MVPVVLRQLAADDEVEGRPLPAGTTVICHLQVPRPPPPPPPLRQGAACSSPSRRAAAAAGPRAMSCNLFFSFVCHFHFIFFIDLFFMAPAGGAPHVEGTRCMAPRPLHARGRVRQLRRGHPCLPGSPACRRRPPAAHARMRLNGNAVCSMLSPPVCMTILLR